MEQPHAYPVKHCKHVENETHSSATRSTRDGKHITYKLSVLQEPQRARACGSGAKSSADRRPVDPPPIVELKIFEGANQEHDITYTMNANYFLFATLEQARPMATPRGAEDKSRLTVLTGTPVAGMVFLDRPSPAGYFIFPDLSVRHEGVYRLSFSLYEELKDPKDNDKTEDSSRAGTPGDAHVTHRLEVKSIPFTVFSAKKFPGLTESTHLSRLVAEQGCRVRIRRDVRMRRRDTKGGDKDWDNYEDDTAQARARMSATPEVAGSGYPSLPAPPGFMDPAGRPRSASNASHHSIAHPISRRTSLQEMNQQYAQPFGSTPHTPQHAYGQTSPYGPSPSQQFSQPPYMQPASAMQPPPPQFGSQSYAPPPPPMAAPAPQQSGLYHEHAPTHPPQPHYAPPEPVTQPQRMSLDYSAPMSADHRRSSSQYSVAPPLSQPPYTPQSAAPAYPPYPHAQSYPPPPPPAHSMYPSQQPTYAPQDSYGKPPPLQPVQPPARASGANTPLSGRPFSDQRSMAHLPPLQMPGDMGGKLEPSSPATTQPQATYYPTPVHDKRSYGDVFRDNWQDRPLRQGARPEAPSYGQSSHSSGYNSGPFAADDDDRQTFEDSMPNLDRMKMAYKRADGRDIIRTLPHYQAGSL